jgi:hypothetical protein
MSIFTILRFATYLYAGIQFSVLFYIYLKGYNLKPSKFPLYLFVMFLCLAIFFFVFGFLCVVKEFNPDLNRKVSWVMALPVAPLIVFSHLFIGESLPNKK